MAQIAPPQERLSFDSASLLAQSPEQSVEDLLSLSRQENSRLGRNDVIPEVRAAIRQNTDWGFQLAEAMLARNEFGSYLWKAVISACDGSGLECARLFAMLSAHPSIAFSAPDETIDLLQRASSQEVNGLETAALNNALETGIEAWRGILGRKGRQEDAEQWHNVAVCDSAGIFVGTVLKILVRGKKEAGEAWIGLPHVWKTYLSEVVGGESWSDAMGRIILAAQVHHLFWLDPGWTISRLLQIYDWSGNRLRAQQAWHGYLASVRWSEDFLEYFLPCCIATFNHLKELGRFRRQFCEHLAAIAVFGSIDPLTHGWLYKFIVLAQPHDLYTWTAGVVQMLKQVPEEQKKSIWMRWLSTYWRRRLQGSPLLLFNVETSALAEWPLEFPHAFGDAVCLLCQSPVPAWANSHDPTLLIRRIKDSSVRLDQPIELARMILYVLNACNALLADDGVRGLVERLIPTAAKQTDLLAICERLAILGFSADAEKLKQRIMDRV